MALSLFKCLYQITKCKHCLVRVLPQWQLDVAAGIHLVRPTARLNTAALGVFKAWLEDRFKAGAPWRP